MNDNGIIMGRRLATTSLCLISLVALAAIVRVIILGGSPAVSLPPAPPLSGIISQSLATSNKPGSSLPVAGKDYTLRSVRYFDNQSWAVASVSTSNNNPNGSVLILQKSNGTYRVVLGPGTAFSDINVQGVPADVVQYLNSQGVVIYAPGNV